MIYGKDLLSASIFGATCLALMQGCGDIELALPGFSPDDPGAVSISINPGASDRGPLAFGENPLVLERDTAVTWINNDTVSHTVSSRSAVFESGNLSPGESFTFTFTAEGAFDYFCRIHPSETGLIVIEATEPVPTASPSPGPTPTTTASPIVPPPPIASPVPVIPTPIPIP